MSDSRELQRRRLARLRDELRDQRVPVPLEGEFGERVVEEIDYARYPRIHEGRVPTYGSLLIDGPSDDVHVGDRNARRVDTNRLPLPWVRRFADGWGSFVVRSRDSGSWLACFEHSLDQEADLVELVREGGGVIVQRTRRGHVKVFTPTVVGTWDGTQWLAKPHAGRFREVVLRLVPEADPQVLEGLLDLCVHWLSPAFRGAIFVWSLHQPANELDGLDLTGVCEGPPLSVANPAHYPALFSLHGQVDGATLIDPGGRCAAYRATLVPSRDATEVVPPDRGTRHTAARRFSYDHPGTVVFVTSEGGPVSIYIDGARVALVSADPSPAAAADAYEGDSRERRLRCPSCRRTLIIDLPRDSDGEKRSLECPVCQARAGEAGIGAVVRGIATSSAARRTDRSEDVAETEDAQVG